MPCEAGGVGIGATKRESCVVSSFFFFVWALPSLCTLLLSFAALPSFLLGLCVAAVLFRLRRLATCVLGAAMGLCPVVWRVQKLSSSRHRCFSQRAEPQSSSGTLSCPRPSQRRRGTVRFSADPTALVLQRKLIRSKKQNRREGKREVKRGRGRGGCQGENSNFHEKERSEKGGREQHGVYTNYTMHQGIHQGGATKDQECFGDQPDGHPWSAPAQLNWSHSSASEKRREGA